MARRETTLKLSVGSGLRPRWQVVFVLFATLFAASCAEIKQPQPEAFISKTKPPLKQEVRWSNGNTPKSFDPAKALAAPETDVVRAIFEGLTTLDPKTLDALPAVAESWSSEDGRVWTFRLRDDARWTNGKPVTAKNFVDSWKRLAALSPDATHRELFSNIKGLGDEAAKQETDADANGVPKGDLPTTNARERQSEAQKPDQKTEAKTHVERPGEPAKPGVIGTFGVEATSDLELRVELKRPDPDFPKLVANPVFFPVYGKAEELGSADAEPPEVSNGPFTVMTSDKTGVVIERSKTYWNKNAVAPQRVVFVPHTTADAALEAYKNGDIDVLTNAAFSPLALKLLAPYDDFRQTTHSAINLYEVNTNNKILADRRVREALAISIDRQKIAEGELDGSTSPATRFLPTESPDAAAGLVFDAERAKELLERSGFPDGENFPALRLVVNRNDAQQRIARTAARMWKQNLNIDVNVVPVETSEIEAVRASGDYDLLRRGVVLPTTDEVVAMQTIFGTEKKITRPEVPGGPLVQQPTPSPTPVQHLLTDPAASDQLPPVVAAQPYSQEAALYDLSAIPIYFPRSFALIKPYVTGFELNSLDAVVLTDVKIDPNWQPAASK
ncbi:MAG TPA: peptide ABC transporter substrate-binding protein [Pyrinomonadaceae bacterium]|nr:peptide ABC transporter substrate-binding protein [Pyrinomonadaceae bacterium]